MFYSIVIPVFNRPDEVDELLGSLCHQTYKQFEVLVIEDGSTTPCNHLIEKYNSRLDLKYYTKPNSGPGTTRNYGVERSKGDYVIILDADCIIPKYYLEEVEKSLQEEPTDAFGGSDKAHDSFTTTQKAINYSMTSFFTTGGIRGGKRKMDKFYPRSFNMGVKREVYLKLGGFSKMRFGEDIDFSIRIFEGGYSSKFIEGAWVYHKRRTNLKRFFKQVYNSGIARINLFRRYPSTLKLVHILPAAFTIGVVTLLILSILISPFFLLPLVIYAILVFIDSSISNKSIQIGLLSIATAFVQLIGYGTGFLNAFWKRCILRKDEFTAFEDSFYK